MSRMVRNWSSVRLRLTPQTARELEFLSNDATDKTAADVTFDQLAAHIEHWLDLGGEDVIALGGDWDGATVPAFLSDASKMPEFQNMLSKHFGKTVMQKLCSDNALAFFERY